MFMEKTRFCTKFFKWFFCKFLYRVEYRNEEYLDEYETYLICPNHSNIFDPFFVLPRKYEKDIHVVAKKELFKHFWFRWIAKQYNVFSIDRENVDVRSMLNTINVFKEDKKAKLILFPEGKVVKEKEELGKVYKKGATFIAMHMDKPIVPVHITWRPRLFGKVVVAFGKPYTIDNSSKSKQYMEENTKKLIDTIYSINIS